MPIYTGGGDEGMTDLRTMERISKSHPRIEACGTVDELNALVGRIRPTGYDDLDDRLSTVQNHLHVIQAAIANPESGTDDPDVTAEHVDRLETWIDAYDDELDPLQSFVLPGGSETGATLHHARTVCRRAERRVVSLAESAPVNPEIVRYLNRLSDVLFVFARVANARDGVSEEHPTY